MLWLRKAEKLVTRTGLASLRPSTIHQKADMQITDDWVESVKDDKGLTNGQKQLFAIWEKKQAFVGFGHLPDQVAHTIETCKGYRGIPSHVRELIG